MDPKQSIIKWLRCKLWYAKKPSRWEDLLESHKMIKKDRKKDEKCYFLYFDLLELHNVNFSLYFCLIFCWQFYLSSLVKTFFHLLINFINC